jgi:hypothetical protein
MVERLLTRVTSIPGVRSLWVRYPFGPVDTRVRFGIWTMPQYAYGVYSAAEQASRLGLKAISVMEFGVAGGRGLLALEDIARNVARHIGMEIQVFGFDTGEGMPAAADYRDLPHVWERGYYKMDVEKLKKRLNGAELVLGDVAETVPLFLSRASLAPIGFVSFDLDYYSSTKSALRLFESGPESRLPRVYSYFDDMVWPEHACHNEYVGELRAIREFNEAHADRKLCPIHMLRHTRPHQNAWNEQMYALHDFAHPLYCTNITLPGDRHRQLPL